jgi:hypothetical protein
VLAERFSIAVRAIVHPLGRLFFRSLGLRTRAIDLRSIGLIRSRNWWLTNERAFKGGTGRTSDGRDATTRWSVISRSTSLLRSQRPKGRDPADSYDGYVILLVLWGESCITCRCCRTARSTGRTVSGQDHAQDYLTFAC